MEKASYGECLRNNADLNGKVDGCQKFSMNWDEYDLDCCSTCGCHQNYHRKVVETTPVKYVAEIVYTKCHKIHNFNLLNSVDGCQEFKPNVLDGITCTVCGCHKGFHRNEITKEKII